MIAYQPIYRVRLGQAAPAPTPAPAPAPASAPSVSPAPAAAAPAVAPVAPIPAGPTPVVATTVYTGVPGFLETVAVLSVMAAAAYTGVRAGMDKDSKKIQRVAGWVGGVGSALLGVLYLGSKTGVTRAIALPQVQVVPA